MWAYYGIGLLSLCQGDLRRALTRLERAIDICQEANVPIFFPRMAAALGAAYTLAGRLTDAMPLLTQAMAQAAGAEMVGFRTLCSLPLGEVHLLAGHVEEAHVLAEQTLTLARAYQERSNEAYALRLLGAIAAHRAPADVDAAAVHYRQALALAEALGMRPLVAHCHHGLGMLFAQTDRTAQARPALATALDLYRAMDMTFWLPQVQAALAQIE
jgi:tetratricopeptide (TPR) repeat protein